MALDVRAARMRSAWYPAPVVGRNNLSGTRGLRFFRLPAGCAVGWHLREIAGRKKVGLELGGNAAVIVHEDANLEYAAKRIAAGGFVNAGQVCISVQRVFLHRPIYERALALILAAINDLKLGDPRDPALISGPCLTG